MKEMSKFSISAFAILGAVLLISAGFVQPATVQASKQLKALDDHGSIGEHLRLLLEDEYFIGQIEWITRQANNGSAYYYILADLAGEVISRDDFKEFIRILEENSSEYSQFLKQYFTEPADKQYTIDAFNENEPEPGIAKLSFKLKKHEGKSVENLKIFSLIKTSFKERLCFIASQISTRNNYLKKELTNILDKEEFEEISEDKQSFQKVLVSSSGEVTYNLLNYDKNTKRYDKILSDKPIIEIVGFQLWLDFIWDVIYNDKTVDDCVDMINRYTTSVDILGDEDTQNSILKITEDEVLKRIVEQISKAETDNERLILKEEFLQALENNEDYQSLLERLESSEPGSPAFIIELLMSAIFLIAGIIVVGLGAGILLYIFSIPVAVAYVIILFLLLLYVCFG